MADGVGPALGGEGSPVPTIAHGGAVWKVGYPTQKAKERFELLVAEYHEESLESRQAIYPPAKYARKCRELEAQLGAGEHRLFGELWTAVVDGPDSVPVLLCSMLQEHHPQATVEDARALWTEVPEKVRTVLAMLIPPFAAVLVKRAPVSQDQKPLKVLELTAWFLGLAGVNPPSATPATPGD